MSTTKQNNPVNHPLHYLKAAVVIEPIELTSRLDSCLGQALQYVMRAPYKGNDIEDLEKAVFYLKKEISNVGSRGYVELCAATGLDWYVFIFKNHTTGLTKRVIKALFDEGSEIVCVSSIQNAIQVIEKELKEAGQCNTAVPVVEDCGDDVDDI